MDEGAVEPHQLELTFLGILLGQLVKSETGNLGKTLDRFVPRRDGHDEMSDQVVNHIGVENKLERDPPEVGVESAQTGLNQAWLNLVLQG